MVWFLDDVLSSIPLSHPLVAYWNAGTKLLFFAAVVAGLGALKEAPERETRAEHERIEREARFARQVQEKLLPQTRPRLRTLEYMGLCEPAGAVGGDCFDFISLGPGVVGLTVGDISGKGFPAALLMASLQALVRSSARARVRRPARLMGEINRSLCLSTTPERYATLFYGVYDDQRRTLTYVNAGHNPPVLVRAAPLSPALSPGFTVAAESGGGPAARQTQVVRLRSGGKILGMFSDEIYVEAEVQVEPGDVLILFTDGVTEALNPDGEEFGEVIGGPGDAVVADLRFAEAGTRPELRAGFEALAAVVAPFCVEVADVTETFWAALHGLAALERSGRIRPRMRGERIALIVRAIVVSGNSARARG